MLYQFPIAIEPVVDVLEVDLRTAAGEPVRPGHLYRVTPGEQFYTPTNHICHFFGNHATLAKCDYLLAYDHCGLLSRIFERQGVQWLDHEATEELTGKAEILPSIRFVFTTSEELESFVQCLRRLQGAARDLSQPAQQDAFELALLLNRQARNPRVMPVAVAAP